jgi:hypothetical protein
MTKQLTIEHIEKQMEAVELTPREVANFKTYLTAIYSLMASKMKEIAIAKPALWLDMRADSNSAKAADMQWEASALGQKETQSG